MRRLKGKQLIEPKERAMQAPREVIGNPRPSRHLDPKASRVPEYVYRAAILVAVVLLLWTLA